MRNRFYFWILFVSGLVLLAFASAAVYRELTPEWAGYQREYKKQLAAGLKDEAARSKAKALPVELQQLYVSGLQRIDRCTSCHVGYENPLMTKAKTPLRQHSGDYLVNHPPERFGCTICHYGQGRATNKIEAHGIGHGTHWDFPVIPVKYIQSSCAQCHDAAALKAKGADQVFKGLSLVNEKGCRGCHKIDGAGGVLGKALAGVGSKPIAYFPMGGVQGEKTTYAWLKQHFIDPRNLVPVSEMKVSVTDEEADQLTAYMLSLRTGEMPKQYRRFNSSPAPALSDGEAVYKKYCIACHGSGKESLFDEVLNRTIPAIMNPAFLKTADNRLLTKLVEEGRAGTQMTSWKASAAGLSAQELASLVEFLAIKRPADRPANFGYAQYKTDAKRGEDVYKVRCWHCHGNKGEGELGLNLRNPAVQACEPEFLAITVRDGRNNTPMPPFGAKGLGLRDQEIADVVSFVKTLAKQK
jgi:mono/diheme cytochrome c family protein